MSFDPQARERLIEVKTTNGPARTPLYLSRNECSLATERPDEWRIYRVHLFATAPHVFTIAPPLKEQLNLKPETWRASFDTQPGTHSDRDDLRVLTASSVVEAWERLRRVGVFGIRALSRHALWREFPLPSWWVAEAAASALEASNFVAKADFVYRRPSARTAKYELQTDNRALDFT